MRNLLVPNRARACSTATDRIGTIVERQPNLNSLEGMLLRASTKKLGSNMTRRESAGVDTDRPRDVT